jgi:Flp pilus assembly protein TadD
MAEEVEIEVERPEPTTTADVALAAALDEARANPKLPPKVEAFFEAQTELARDQRHHMAIQFKLEHRARFLDVWSKRLKLLLQAMTVAVGALAAFAVGALAWQAHEDRALTIAAVDAPPDFAARGLSGRVLAGQLQDMLARMQRETVDLNAPARVRAAEEREIRVEMPEAGLSLAEVQSLLQQWLSRRIEVQAALSHPPEVEAGALVATVRAGEEPGVQLVQTDGNVDAALQKAAEHVYQDIYPARYANWLDQHGRTEEALPILRRLTGEGSMRDRANAFVLLARTGNFPGAQREALLREAVRLDPISMEAWNGLASGTPDGETRLSYYRRAMEAEEKRPIPTVAGMFPYMNYHRELGETVDSFQGSCRQLDISPCTDEAYAEVYLASGRTGNTFNASQASAFPTSVLSIASRHDTKIAAVMLAAPRADLTGRSEAVQSATERSWLLSEVINDLQREDWSAVGQALEGSAAFKASSPNTPYMPQLIQVQAWALAHLGRADEAEARLALLGPAGDPLQMLRIRALSADLKGDTRGAEAAWAKAVAVAPSYPQAEADWGQSLLRRGNADGAIAKLMAANRKAPHFADPIEAWGEALMAKGDFAGAAGRFAEAVKYAPSWGRLHLKWAEALARQGKTAEARTHKQAAAAQDLTPAERTELNGLSL